MTKVKIPSKAKIRVFWSDTPENYTKERQKRINTYLLFSYYGMPMLPLFFSGQLNMNDCIDSYSQIYESINN